MNELQKIHKKNILYLYFLFYFLFTFCTVLKDSKVTPVLIGDTYIFVEILFIGVNLFVIFTSNKIFKAYVAIFLVILTIFPYILFKSQIISPFFLSVYLMIITSTILIQPKKLLKTDLMSKSISVFLVFYLCYERVLPDGVTSRGLTGITRHSFGFNSPNTPDLMIMSIILSLMLLSIFYINRNKYLLYVIILIMLIISFIIYHFTDSKECLVSILLLLALLAINTIKLNSVKTIISKLPVLSYVSCVIVSMYFVFICDYDSNLFFNLDKFMTNRLSGLVMAFSIYPVKLLGYTNLPELQLYHPTVYNPLFNSEFSAAGLDNGYMADLMRLGIVGLIILSIVIFYVIRLVDKNKKYLCCISLTVILITLLSVQCKIFYITLPICVNICCNTINKKPDLSER